MWRASVNRFLEVCCAKSLSCAWLFATPRTVACRLLCPWGFSRQVYWNPVYFFSIQWSNRGLPHCRQILYHLEKSMATHCIILTSVQFSSVTQSCPTLCDSMDCSTPSLPVLHQHPELAQTHIHRVGDVIQPSQPLSSPSPPAFSLSQHQGLFKWVSTSHQVAKVLELQFQHQSFQWIFRTDFL